MEKSYKEVYMEVVRETEAELDGIMNVSLVQLVKDTAKKAMGRSVRTKDPMFWPAGMLMLGLICAAEDESMRAEVMAHISAHTDMWLRDYSGRIDYVDDALAGFCFVRAYEYTGEDKYREAAEKIADFIARSPRDNDGSVIYNPGRDTGNIFADGIGQVSMFMAAFERAFSDSDIAVSAGARLSAARQLKSFLNHGLDERTGLIYHGYSMEENERKGLLGWGRAFGWLFMGLTEAAVAERELSGGGIFKEKGNINAETIKNSNSDITSEYRRFCRTALEYQRADGGWSWQLQAVDGHIDMSATGMIAYCLARGIRTGLFEPSSEKVLIALEKARKCMFSHISEGIVDDALSSCDDFGVHYQTYGSYPWGQGAVLAALGSCGLTKPTMGIII